MSSQPFEADFNVIYDKINLRIQKYFTTATTADYVNTGWGETKLQSTFAQK